MTFRADGRVVEVVHFPGHVNFWCSGEPNWLAPARSPRSWLQQRRWDGMTADRRHTWRTRCTGGTCSACWSQHAVFADDHGHVVIEVLAAKSELFARPLPNREGVRTCERVTSLEIVIVQALAKSRSDIGVEVDIDDHNLRVLVYRLFHSKETGVSYGSSNTRLAIKCSLLCGTSDASQYHALRSHQRRSLIIRNVNSQVEKEKNQATTSASPSSTSMTAV